MAYDAAHARPKAPGRIVLTVDGKTVGSPLAFTADTQGAIVLPEFATTLGTGKHTVALKMEDGSTVKLIYENRGVAAPSSRAKARPSSRQGARRRSPRRVGKIPIE